MANDDPTPAAEARPQPGLVTTFGFLNLLLGSLLLLAELGCLRLTASALSGEAPVRFTPETIQAVFEDIRSRRIGDLQAQERAAAGEEKKAEIRARLRKVEASHPRAEKEVDFAKLNRGVAWILRYLAFDLRSGPVVNVLMVVAGIGLVLQSQWGRWLGVATAALKLVRLIVLFVLMVGFVVPQITGMLGTLLATDMGRQIVAQAIEQQPAWQKAAPGQQPGAEDVVAMVGSYANAAAIFFVCVGAIYPAIALILLSRAGARAACSRREPPPAETAPPSG